jgi:hypothetical protein
MGIDISTEVAYAAILEEVDEEEIESDYPSDDSCTVEQVGNFLTGEIYWVALVKESRIGAEDRDGKYIQSLPLQHAEWDKKLLDFLYKNDLRFKRIGLMLMLTVS